MNSNNFRSTLVTSASGGPTIIEIPFVAAKGTISTVTPTSQFYYPCTIWVTPNSGSSVTVNTSFDGTTLNTWSNGTVTAFATGGLASCPGAITFELVSGTGATVGIT